MRLYQINQNGNKYCGPSVISALAGIGTKEAAAIVRARNGNERIRGSNAFDVRKALEQLGFSMEPLPRLRVTLRQWAKANAKGNDVYLIAAGQHWILVQGRYAQCGKTIDLVPVPDHPNARRFVTEAYVVKRVKKINPDTVIPQSERAPKLCLDEQSARRKTKTLATKYGIEIEQEDPHAVIWVHCPDSVSEDEDPWEDEHYADYWTQALEKVEAYVSIIKAKTVATASSDRDAP